MLFFFTATVGLYRISADRKQSGPTNTARRGGTAAAEAVRTQCLGWERLVGLYQLCSAGLSCAGCCAVPSSVTSTSGQTLHSVGYSRAPIGV